MTTETKKTLYAGILWVVLLSITAIVTTLTAALAWWAKAALVAGAVAVLAACFYWGAKLVME